MGIEDHKLKIFCTVAEVKSFSKASEIIHLTQPAVSLQIQALEEFYETKLLDRTSNNVTLTPSGEILYRYAKEILSLYADAEKNIGKLTGLAKGSIVIGASSTIGNYLLPKVIADFRKMCPKIKVNITIGNTKKIVELLHSFNIDVGLVEGDVKSQKIVMDSLLEDELYVIVPSGHPWSKNNEISILDLVKEPFIFREEGSGTRQAVEKSLLRHGINPHNMEVSLILGSNEAIKEAVENGMGISIVSQWAVKKETKCGSIKMLGIKEEKVIRDFSLVFSKNGVSSHGIEEFLLYIKKYPFDNLLLH